MLPPLPPAPPITDTAPPPQPPGALAEEAGRCANCLTPLTGPFCAQCGQHVADYHRSVWRFVVDFFDNVFCWDNKLFRTLDPLFKRPGWLTQEFMAGRRVRYVHPLRLFLFTSAVCLTLLQFNHGFDLAHVRVGKKTRPVVSVQTGEDKDDEDDDEKKPAASPSPSPASSVAPAPAVPAAPPALSSPPASPAVSPTPARRGDEKEQADSLGSILRDTLNADLNGEKDPQKKAELARRLQVFGKDTERMKKLNQDVTTNLQQRASWVALAMLPIFAWLMRFAYGRRGGFFFAYLVFSLHYHTFLMMFWTAFTWLGTAVQATHITWLGFPLVFGFLGPPCYLYLSLKRFYGESRARTAAKTFAIGGLHLLAIIIGVAIAGAGSALVSR